MAEATLKAVPQPRPNLRQKLVACMQEIEHVDKRGDNRAQGYKYVKAEDVINAARAVMAKNGIAFAATEIGVEDREDYETKSGATMSVVRVRMLFKFLDCDSEEQIEVCGTGEGQDTGDKGINKAKTAALKYVLTQNLLMSTGDDPEDERGAKADHERSHPVPQGQSRAPQAQPFRVPPCPACGHATAMTKKRDGTWACFASKGGCNEEFTQETLDEALGRTNPTPTDKNAPQGTPAQARGIPEEDVEAEVDIGNGPKRERIVATDEQIKQVIDLIQQSRVPEETHAWVLKGSAVNNLADLNPTQAAWWIENLNRRLKETQGNGQKKGRK